MRHSHRWIGLLTLAVTCLAMPAWAQGTVEYYHVDALGSVRAVTDQSGAVVRRHDYFPFGEEYLAQTGRDARRFTGQERDAETGLDSFGARAYASRSGRFTTADPGHVGGNVLDPQSWNAYAYARSNPLRFVDPTGTDYIIAAEGGEPFWFDQGFGDFGALNRYLRGQGFSPLGSSDWGYILNAGGQIVAEYSYFSRSARVFGGVGLVADRWLNEQLSDMAVNTALAAGGGLVAGALSGGLASEGPSIISRALDTNKLNHIFGKGAHNLGPLVARFGSEAAAYAALERATQAAVRSQGLSGVYRVTVNVGGQAVEVTGKVVNGIVRIGTAYIR